MTSALSLPHHRGNGVIGGFFPTISFAIVASTGDIYSGLWYPIGFALLTVLVGVVFLHENKNIDVETERPLSAQSGESSVELSQKSLL